MKLNQVQRLLSAAVLTGENHLEDEVHTACGCDLMSDVLRFAKEDGIMLTGLVNKQVINTADMANMHSIIFVRGKKPGQELIDLAKDIDMLIMTTKTPMFESCGILYANGLKGAKPKNEL
ncbi:MAG: hypothetical protein PHI94_02930 [Eubacteriaceae bacterium]|jgi:predicted transcriptional regulator|nr:hypothetical protein [Eubacteriaceae bacterium]MDD4508653.1 hypothetical protein [Eubacteriaceae bacterium]